MRVLGIDQSFKKSGIVVLEKGKPDMVHYEKYCVTDKSEDPFERTWLVACRVRDLVIQYNIDHVCIEGLAFGSMGNNTRDLAGLQFMIVNMVKFIMKDGPTIEVIPPQTLKKFATGKGNSKKELVIEALKNQYPKEYDIFSNVLRVKKTTGMDDMCDAYWLAQIGLSKV